MEELIAAWRHTPMSDVERGAYRDLFAAYAPDAALEVAVAVIRDLSIPGHRRPDIHELGQLMNSKLLALHRAEEEATQAERDAQEPPTAPRHVPTLMAAIREGQYAEEIDALARELKSK